MKRIAITFWTLLILGMSVYSQPYYDFDGSNDYKAIPQLNYSGSLAQVTVEAWVKTDFVGSSYNDNWAIVDFDRSEWFDLFVRGDNGQVGFSTASGIDDFYSGSGHSVNDGNWHHIAGVFDGTDKIIYIDGVEVARTTPSHGALGSSPRWGFIGDGSEATGYDGDRNNIYYDGQIDEVRIWNTALSEATLNEWMGKALNTSHPNFAHLDYASTSLEFDGTDDYVAIQNFNYSGTGHAEVTVECWIKTANGGSQVVASYDRNEFWRLEIAGSGAGTGQIGWDLMTNSGQIDFGSNARVDDGEWHHIAAVYDNGAVKIYIDGGLDASTTKGSTFGSSNTRYGYVGVGSESSTFDNSKGPEDYFDGQIDEFRIWNVALDQSTIQEFMYQGAQGNHPNIADLEVYFPIYLTGSASTTGGSSLTVSDWSGNNYDGTMSNMVGAENNRAMEATFAVPTLSQWGLIILSLLTLSLVSVVVSKKELVLAGPNNSYSLIQAFRDTFNKDYYLRILKFILPMTLITFVIVQVLIGTNGALDFTGTLISSAIIAYILHIR